MPRPSRGYFTLCPSRCCGLTSPNGPQRPGVRARGPYMRHAHTARGEHAMLDQALAELSQSGYQVLHNLDVGHARVSHCVVGPTGVFAIEAEDHTEPGRVLGEAHRVERLLHAAGVEQEVCPVIALTKSRRAHTSDHVSMVNACDVVSLVRSPKMTLPAD